MRILAQQNMISTFIRFPNVCGRCERIHLSLSLSRYLPDPSFHPICSRGFRMFYLVFSVWCSIAFVTEFAEVWVYRSMTLSDVIYTFWYALHFFIGYVCLAALARSIRIFFFYSHIKKIHIYIYTNIQISNIHISLSI